MNTTNHGGNVVALPISNPRVTAKEQIAALMGTKLDQLVPDIDAVEDELSVQYFLAFLGALAHAENRGGLETWRPKTLATKRRAFEFSVVMVRELLEDMADAIADKRTSGGPER